MEIKIRKAKIRNLIKISEIFRLESNKKPYSGGWTKKTALADTKKSFKEEDIYVAIVNKKIVGFIVSTIVPKGDAFVSELWVTSKYQKKGVGKSLMKYIENKYRKKGIKSIDLSTTKNTPAVKFYKKLNYQIKRETIRFTKKLK